MGWRAGASVPGGAAGTARRGAASSGGGGGGGGRASWPMRIASRLGDAGVPGCNCGNRRGQRRRLAQTCVDGDDDERRAAARDDGTEWHARRATSVPQRNRQRVRWRRRGGVCGGAAVTFFCGRWRWRWRRRGRWNAARCGGFGAAGDGRCAEAATAEAEARRGARALISGASAGLQDLGEGEGWSAAVSDRSGRHASTSVCLVRGARGVGRVPRTRRSRADGCGCRCGREMSVVRRAAGVQMPPRWRQSACNAGRWKVQRRRSMRMERTRPSRCFFVCARRAEVSGARRALWRFLCGGE